MSREVNRIGSQVWICLAPPRMTELRAALQCQGMSRARPSALIFVDRALLLGGGSSDGNVTHQSPC